ncbi:TPA: hypothetical protein ACJME7_000314 [Neisseria meningitidis]|nr:hypothetical protein [Neisseria meningitidis]
MRQHRRRHVLSIHGGYCRIALFFHPSASDGISGGFLPAYPP